jgi:hypothetical protein
MPPHPIPLVIKSYERKTGFLLVCDFQQNLTGHRFPHIYPITATEKQKEGLLTVAFFL